MSIAWDAANDGGMTLTNNGLTISSDGMSGNNPYNAIANQSFTTGKYYFECTIVELGSITGFMLDNWQIGIGCATAWPGTPGNGWVGQSGGALYAPPGDALVSNGQTANVTSTIGVGDVIGVAVDHDGMNVDFFLNGAENSSGSQHIWINNTAMYPCVTLMPGNKITVNFGGSAFVHTPPTGYSAYPGASLASISISPTSVVWGSGPNTITVTGTTTAFSGSADFTITGGSFDSFQSQTIVSDTSATLVYSPGINTGSPVTITDTTSNSQATLNIVNPDLGTIIIGCVGDSITAGVNSDPVSAMEDYLNSLGYTATCVNQGHGGSTTANWASTAESNYLDTALAAFATAGVSIVSIMLGTNDAQTVFNITPDQHYANMRNIVGRCIAAGFKAVFHKPLYTAPNAMPWPVNPNALYDQYWIKDQGLIDGVNVFAGDSSNYSYVSQNPGALASDGVHPANSNSGIAIGKNWGFAVLHKIGRPARWTHS